MLTFNGFIPILFYLKRQVVKKDGTVPIMGRITVDGSQTQFSCKLTVDPKLWDTKGGRVTGRSSAALETNRMLDKMRVRINKHYQEIMERDNFVTAEKVKNAFLGLEHRYHTLMQVFRQHNEDYEKQVEAGMKAKGTLLKYKTVYKHLQEFLTIRYHVKDIALKELTPAFISDFEMFQLYRRERTLYKSEKELQLLLNHEKDFFTGTSHEQDSIKDVIRYWEQKGDFNKTFLYFSPAED